MSSLLDMISSFIALLMSVAFLHFGAASGEDAVKVDPPSESSQKAAAQGSASAANQPAPATATPAKAIRQVPIRRP